jgi:O-acetyl-ADP-ribose deacetylase (regulator of RNase III)
MVHFAKGDLFKSDYKIFVHGVNTRGAFGSGVAGIIANLYPWARESYMIKYKTEGWKLGNVQIVSQNEGRYIANCATQDDYGYENVCHASYPAIRECLTKVKEFAQSKGYTVAMPKIGAGLAGGDWTIIKAIIEDVFTDYDATVFYLDTV